MAHFFFLNRQPQLTLEQLLREHLECASCSWILSVHRSQSARAHSTLPSLVRGTSHRFTSANHTSPVGAVPDRLVGAKKIRRAAALHYLAARETCSSSCV